MAGNKSPDELEKLRAQIRDLEDLLCLKSIENQQLEKIIHEDRIRQAKLREQVEMKDKEFSAVFEGSHDALSFHDAVEGKILRANSKVAQLTGYDVDQLIAIDLNLISNTASGIFNQDYVYEMNARVFKDGMQRLEWQAKDICNNVFWLDLILKPAFFNNRQVILAAARDISDFVEAQQRIYELQQERVALEHDAAMYRRLRLLTDGLPQVIWIANAEGQITFWNYRFFEISGLPLSTALTDKWHQLIHPDDAPGFMREWKQCVATGCSFEYDFRMRKLAGTNSRIVGMYRWYTVRAVARFNEHGKVAEWYGTFNDSKGVS